MKKTGEKNGKKRDYTGNAILGTLGIIAISVFLLEFANIVLPFNRYFFANAIIFTGINLLSISMFFLSTYLIFIYLRDYLELKSSFTLGVIFALIAFMLFSITSTPLIHDFLGVYGRPGPFSFVPYIFATIALIILTWLSSK